MRQNIREIHVNHTSVKERSLISDGLSEQVDDYIITLLRSLITAPNSLPKLKWLDVSKQAYLRNSCDLIDADSLAKLPLAVPSLETLCLDACFHSGEGMQKAISPFQLKAFFSGLPLLTSLSVHNPGWMTDEHVAAFMPIIGHRLRRLELIACNQRPYSGHDKAALSDTSLEVIAQNAKNLVSFAIVDSNAITSAGLEKVFRANPKITTLNLSYCPKLDERTMTVISQNLLQLKELRCYWSLDRHGSFGVFQKDLWFNDDTLLTLIKSQERESDTYIPLQLLGVLKRDNLSARSLGFALSRGVDIEIDRQHNSELCDELEERKSDDEEAILIDAKYYHYVDGSLDSEDAIVVSQREGILASVSEFGFGFFGSMFM